MQHFRERGSGVLINMSSYLGKGSAPYHSSYVVSKHGVRGLGMALRQDLLADGIRGIHVCTVMPTSHDTPFFHHAGNHTGKPVRPTPPVYDPQEVVDTIVRLAVQPEDEVMVGTSAKVASIAGKIVPSLLERRMAQKLRKEHMEQTETASETSGSVFEPMRTGTELRGVWAGKGTGSKKLATVFGIGIPVALGVIAVVTKTRGGRRRTEAA